MSTGLPRPADGCPKCITEERLVVADPYAVEAVDSESIRAFYRCPGCDYHWWTGWLTSWLDADSGTEPAA